MTQDQDPIQDPIQDLVQERHLNCLRQFFTDADAFAKLITHMIVDSAYYDGLVKKANKDHYNQITLQEFMYYETEDKENRKRAEVMVGSLEVQAIKLLYGLPNKLPERDKIVRLLNDFYGSLKDVKDDGSKDDSGKDDGGKDDSSKDDGGKDDGGKDDGSKDDDKVKRALAHWEKLRPLLAPYVGEPVPAKKGKRGRPITSDVNEDKRIEQLWKSGEYKNYEECARAASVNGKKYTRRDVELALQRQRGRKRRRA